MMPQGTPWRIYQSHNLMTLLEGGSHCTRLPIDLHVPADWLTCIYDGYLWVACSCCWLLWMWVFGAYQDFIAEIQSFQAFVIETLKTMYPVTLNNRSFLDILSHLKRRRAAERQLVGEFETLRDACAIKISGAVSHNRCTSAAQRAPIYPQTADHDKSIKANSSLREARFLSMLRRDITRIELKPEDKEEVIALLHSFTVVLSRSLPVMTLFWRDNVCSFSEWKIDWSPLIPVTRSPRSIGKYVTHWATRENRGNLEQYLGRDKAWLLIAPSEMHHMHEDLCISLRRFLITTSWKQDNQNHTQVQLPAPRRE